MNHLIPVHLTNRIGANGADASIRRSGRSTALRDTAQSRRWNLELVRELTAAKNQYWQAVRHADNPRPELMINLANTLSTSGRIAEAMLWYDRALARSPEHPMAHGNRSDCLVWLNRLSFSSSLTMVGQIALGYQQALRSSEVRSVNKNNWRRALEQAQQFLTRHGTTISEITSDHSETAREADEHSPYRRFCIRERLMLAEHAIYCPCAGARRDSLTIFMNQIGLGGDYLPSMEILLNRLKAEFNSARVFYYQAGGKPIPAWSTEEFESTFSDFSEDAAVDLRTELLRTSFRLCFGILDRIAFGVCSLLTPSSHGGNLYFHSFWGRQGSPSERWHQLNEWSNQLPCLVALYSQATDLNQTDGEWRHLRQYRNALEHELLLIGAGDGDILGPFGDPKFFKSIQSVSQEEFSRQVVHLLRFTASAIFSFALLVRQRAYIERQEERGPAIPVTKKPIGPD